MRFIPALLFCIVAISPLSLAAPDDGLPLSLNDLKLEHMDWKFPITDYVTDASLAWCEVDGQDLFILDSAHTLHCLDLARGVHRWILNLDEKPTQAPGIGADSIAVAITDRLVLAKRKNGARYLDKPIKALPTTSPAVTADAAYVSVYVQNRLYAVDGATGITGWSYRFKDYIATAPRIYGTAAERFLYAAAHDGAVVCLAPLPALRGAPGKPAWVFKTTGHITADLTFSGSSVLVACEDTCLYCLNRLTGGITWKYSAGVPLKKAAQVTADGMLFLPTEREFICIDLATGKEKWKYDSGMLAAVVNGIAYVKTCDRRLALLDAESGTFLKDVALGDSVCVVPNLTSGLLILVSGTDLFGLK